MDFDAATFSVGWLAACLSSQKHPTAILNKTIALEVYNGRGIRLVALDGNTGVMAWCPEGGKLDVPNVDDRPDEVLVYADAHRRVKILMSYVLNRAWASRIADADTDETVTGKLPTGSGHYVTVSTGPAVRQQLQLDGIEDGPDLIVSFDGVESVRLQQVATSFPDWRNVMDPARLAFGGERVGRLVMSPDTVDRVAKLAALAKRATKEPQNVQLWFDADRNVIVQANKLPDVLATVYPLPDIDATADPVDDDTGETEDDDTVVQLVPDADADADGE